MGNPKEDGQGPPPTSCKEHAIAAATQKKRVLETVLSVHSPMKNLPGKEFHFLRNTFQREEDAKALGGEEWHKRYRKKSYKRSPHKAWGPKT